MTGDVTLVSAEEVERAAEAIWSFLRSQGEATREEARAHALRRGVRPEAFPKGFALLDRVMDVITQSVTPTGSVWRPKVRDRDRSFHHLLARVRRGER